MSDTFSGQLDVSPWDSLLLEVRRASYRVAWIDQRLEGLVADERALRANAGEDGLEEDVRRGRLRGIELRIQEWMAESRKERVHLAQTSKRAVDAGLTQRMVSQVALEAETITRIIVGTMEACELSVGQRDRGMARMGEIMEQIALERRGDLREGGQLGQIGGTATGPVKMRVQYDEFGRMVYRPEVERGEGGNGK